MSLYSSSYHSFRPGVIRIVDSIGPSVAERRGYQKDLTSCVTRDSCVRRDMSSRIEANGAKDFRRQRNQRKMNILVFFNLGFALFEALDSAGDCLPTTAPKQFVIASVPEDKLHFGQHELIGFSASLISLPAR